MKILSAISVSGLLLYGGLIHAASNDVNQTACTAENSLSTCSKSDMEFVPRIAPVNADFLLTRDEAAALTQEGHDKDDLPTLVNRDAAVTQEGHPTGYLPSPIDRSHMIGLNPYTVGLQPKSELSFPSSFDLRTSSDVSSVKNQGSCGDCWAFSSMASVESNTLVSGGAAEDYSENHLNVRHGFNRRPCYGGNNDMSGAYMSRWISSSSLAAGVVYESDDPYTSTKATSVPGLSPRVHLQEFLALPDRSPINNNDNYKYALQNFGAISVSLYVDSGMSSSKNSAYWSQDNKAFYYPGSTSSNHAVALVGWDDTYPAGKFKTAPPGNGAFIVKNSWGTDWGNSGYFYLSYYTKLYAAHVFRTPEKASNYTRAYLYDPFGQSGATGYGEKAGWGANVFTATANENLNKVAFNTLTVNTGYEVYVYTNTSGAPSTGTLEGKSVNTKGTIPFAGYHTIPLSRSVTLKPGQKFAVAVKFTTPGYLYPIPLEHPYDNPATASAGQSYMSADGSAWVDVTKYYPKDNVDIRAFTTDADVPGVPTVTTNAASVITTDKATINGIVRDNEATTHASFDYGSTTSYGTNLVATTPAGGTVDSGAGNTAVSVTLSGLSCGSTYHYRAVGSNGYGTISGNDMTFTTTACPTSILTVTKSTSGSIVSNPKGIDCGTYCSYSYLLNNSVTLTAKAATGYLFSSWGGACTGTVGNVCTVTMNSGKSVSAIFKVAYSLTVTKNGTGQGTVSSKDIPQTISCGATCKSQYLTGTMIILTATTATPASNSLFKAWSGGCTGTAPTCTVTMNVDKTVTATFTLR